MQGKYIRNSVLYISPDYWIVSKGYTLYKYYPERGKHEVFAKVNDPKNAFRAKFGLTARLFRSKIRHLYHFQNDTWMCIGVKALFKLNPSIKSFVKCCSIEKGSRPMNLCQASDGTIYYVEYCFNPDRKEMRIFQSKDNGESWSVVYTFRDGEINHIHGVFQDLYSNKIWVATGDDDTACIFGYTEDGFKTFVRKYQGTQQVRVCQPFFTKDEIIFATDSQFEQNYIRSINRETGEIKNLQPIQGSGIFGVQIGNKMLVSTTVEPSKVNLDQFSHVWMSEDGHSWNEIASFKKDLLPMRLFQMGSILFPTYEGNSDYIVLRGRALKGLDGKSLIIQTK